MKTQQFSFPCPTIVAVQSNPFQVGAHGLRLPSDCGLNEHEGLEYREFE